MSKYTKGPWEAKYYTAQKTPSHFWIHKNISEGHDIVLAKISAEFPESISLGEKAANAHLIAAAPDLLEACNNFIQYLDGGKAKRGTSTRCINAIRQAISKARGGS